MDDGRRRPRGAVDVAAIRGRRTHAPGGAVLAGAAGSHEGDPAQRPGGHGEGTAADVRPRGVDPTGRRRRVGRGVAVPGCIPDDAHGEVLEPDRVGRLRLGVRFAPRRHPRLRPPGGARQFLLRLPVHFDWESRRADDMPRGVRRRGPDVGALDRDGPAIEGAG